MNQFLHKLLKDNELPLMVSFSGGCDSLVLSHYLKHRGYNPTLVHFQHNLIPEDQEIKDKAEKAANFLGLQFITEKSQNVFKRGSQEAFCRNERISFFQDLGANLAMGHHLGDATENYVNNCLRGCPEHAEPLPVISWFKTTRVFRPMILVSKKDILAYLSKHKLENWVAFDPLNEDLRKKRNWIRTTLLPEISKRINLEKTVKKRLIKVFEKNGLTKPETRVY